MKAADVSVAMLTGYGSQGRDDGDGDIDHENERRRERLRLKPIGKNRRNALAARSGASSSMDAIIASHGVGDSPAAKQARLRQKIDEALKEISQSAVSGQGSPATRDSTNASYSWSDVRILMSSIWRGIKEERQRSRALRKGGGTAAKVLAEEDRLRRSVLKSSGKDPSSSSTLHAVGHEESGDVAIKPGEACLASSFTFLRPCIDGADALIRAGVAAAGCSLSLHKNIALNCLMSCFNLATLYRDGFRYGRYMWNAELAFIMATDRASYQASCMSRPRIARVRPDSSVFSSSNLISVVAQAAIHLSTLTVGSKLGAGFEHTSAAEKAKKGFRLRWTNGWRIGDTGPSGHIADKGGTLTASEGNSGGGLLGRPKFRPNMVTNTVFLLSIFQNAVITLTNHQGRPFYGGILESRSLCLAIGGAILFCLLCVAEKAPWVNALLELAPLPTRGARIKLLLLFAIDFVGCYAVECLSLFFLEPELWEEGLRPLSTPRPGDAASEEELLLQSEVKDNSRLVRGLALIAGLLILDISVSH